MSVATHRSPDRALATLKETRSMSRSRLARLGFGLAAALCLTALLAASALAASPRWELEGFAPDEVTPGKEVKVEAWVVNTGEVPLTGTLTVTDTFPSQIPAVEPSPDFEGTVGAHSCQLVGQESSCEFDVEGLVPGGEILISYRNESQTPGPIVDPGATGTFTNRLTASGGGMAGQAEVQQPMTVLTSFPPFQIKRFAVEPVDSTDAPAPAVAGTAPYELDTSIAFRSLAAGTAGGVITETTPPEHLRDTTVHLPPGLIGYPTATVRCTSAEFSDYNPLSESLKTPNCPPGSQVGMARLFLSGFAVPWIPLYNLVPPPGYPAAFGFNFENINTLLLARLRPADNGVDIVTVRTPAAVNPAGVDTRFWGVPADPRHDYLRSLCDYMWTGNSQGNKCSAGSPPEPFLRLPTSCPGSESPWGFEVDTYENPGVIHSAQTTSPATQECELTPFEPDVSLAPSSRSPGSPTGLDATLTLPQPQSPNGRAEADLRRAEVTLPPGMAINPSAAGGLEACSDSQLRLGISGAAECPDASKIGSLTLQTPLLDHPLSGSVFIRRQGSGTPQSGDLYRLALEIRSDEDGVDIKLPGRIEADPQTGQLTTVFDELPQLPFESMQLHLDAGPRAALVNPPGCGTQTAAARFTGWNGKVVDTTAKFTTSSAGGCERGFDPHLAAGTENELAGATSPFHLRLTREDASQELGGLKVTLPPGLSGYLKGIPYCPDGALAGISTAVGSGAAEEASPACPAASQVGTVTVGAGAGVSPFYTQAGRAYLAGPYKGAPLSLAAVVPAVAGPFDLGSVVVRNAVHVDPTTAQLTIQSDPLPSILQGIPLELRDVRVDINRDHFTLNPTSCEPMSIEAEIASTSGASVHRTQPFQAGSCERLAFKPRLALQLRGPTHRAAHPSLRAVLRARPGEANIGKASVLLPRTELLENAHIRTVCTRVQYNAGDGGGAGCPAGSVYGYAKAWSPLLDQPLQGPVYLRSNGGERELPDLVASLGGQIHIDLVGYIDSVKARIRNRFATVPDAPVSKFELTMQGGRKGLLANNVNLCRAKPRATVGFEGQNGKVQALKPPVKVDCGGKRGRHGR